MDIGWVERKLGNRKKIIKGYLLNRNVQHFIAIILVCVLIQVPKIYQLGSEPLFDKKVKIGNERDGGKGNEGSSQELRCLSKIVEFEDKFMKGGQSKFILLGGGDRERMEFDLNCTLESIGNVSDTTIVFKNYSLGNMAWYYGYARMLRNMIDDLMERQEDGRNLWVLYDFDGNSSYQDIRSICQNDRNRNDVILIMPKWVGDRDQMERKIRDNWMDWDIVQYQESKEKEQEQTQGPNLGYIEESNSKVEQEEIKPKEKVQEKPKEKVQEKPKEKVQEKRKEKVQEKTKKTDSAKPQVNKSKEPERETVRKDIIKNGRPVTNNSNTKSGKQKVKKQKQYSSKSRETINSNESFLYQQNRNNHKNGKNYHNYQQTRHGNQNQYKSYKKNKHGK